MTQVGIEREGLQGRIIWDERDPGSFQVIIDCDDTRRAVQAYLRTRREFHIPEANRIDDTRSDTCLPTDTNTYFELALNTLYANTGVWVEW